MISPICQQITAEMMGLKCHEETLTWIRKFYQYCAPSEYPLLRTRIFYYHCTCICSRIRSLLNEGVSEELLLHASSILQEFDGLPHKTSPLTDAKPIRDNVIEAPDCALPAHMNPSYKAAQIYRSIFKLRVLYHILEFLFYASRAPGCTSQQRIIFLDYRHRCIEEMRAHAIRASLLLDIEPDWQSLPQLDSHIRSRLIPKTGPINCIPNLLAEA